MAKRATVSEMTTGEKRAGLIFFALYLLVLPLLSPKLFAFVGRLLDTQIPLMVQNAIYYYAVFAVTLVIFHRYVGKTSAVFAERLGPSCRTALLGLVALYGLNELVYRVTRVLADNRTNLNDSAISAHLRDAPRVTLLIVVILAPFVEEVLFRGLVFGNLREKSRPVAYAVSCLLFALLHVWQFALVRQDAAYFWLMVQYLVPGLVLAWAYDRSGTLWTSVMLHAAANALSMWAMK
ncbi:MAG: CPBP family intramembrane metalloprotease [Oscillibacter sp.]|nr:CPBP family intramembrane metalloprotease [Oscillibacter sp.]